MFNQKKKEIIAMLLAGGQGSRLGVLTERIAKPAVPFGGKYRIIDFPLSNCVNSNIDTIGVLTQYQPLELNAYIGSGQPWDLDRIYGGAFILPPYMDSEGGQWYKGTANAIYQNMNFIDQYDPDYVLILSGDHVYKMNYADMLEYHKEKQADCTISVLQVPWEEASRFGVMNADQEMRIYEFEEKPADPKSNLASMGVYIFNWKKLKEYLIKDEADKKSDNDFGKNLIPAMLQAGERMYAYVYGGYWKDVGTIESLWQSNMDTIDPTVPLELDDPPWRIYSRSANKPPQYIGEHAELSDSGIADGCWIDGKIENSIIFSGVTVEEGATVSNSILMPRVTIRANSRIDYAIVAENSEIGEDSCIGWADEGLIMGQDGQITVVGPDLTLGNRVKVARGAIVSTELKDEEVVK
ncbi:MAG TPA: glucose-1-phosphate adenylyltransferase [Clostridiales bacterium]|jgi:glucose-1-phosphate adenylyltransferase|nr:glucose-1-phosphate adenylyltransferase [Clostridiales bacterium]